MCLCSWQGEVEKSAGSVSLAVSYLQLTFCPVHPGLLLHCSSLFHHTLFSSPNKFIVYWIQYTLVAFNLLDHLFSEVDV